MPDLRDLLFASCGHRKVTASIVADEGGVMAETGTAAALAGDLGLAVTLAVEAGDEVRPGDIVMTVVGTPTQVARGEEQLVGVMAKPSGVATAARRFVTRAGPGLRVVAGAWKKVPPGQKDATRAAIAVGGADLRICPPPFVYLDKNYVTMLGGVGPALTTATAELSGHRRVIQVDTAAAALEAARHAADVVFVDTGRPADLRAAAEVLRRHRLRDQVRLAFGGNVQLRDLDALRRSDADIVDVGRAIVDAPLLDLHLRITEGEP